MTASEVLGFLQTNATEQTRKTYLRHQQGCNCLGVNFGVLNPLAKKLKANHALAQELWEIGFFETRALALMIAEPHKTNIDELESWVLGIAGRDLGGYMARVVAKAKGGSELAARWRNSDREGTATVGWVVVTVQALENNAFPDEYFEAFVPVIEAEIHQAANSVREAMNNTLIAIGQRNLTLEEMAIAAADRIGKVLVDHGDTNCKTPDAKSYILKAKAKGRLRA